MPPHWLLFLPFNDAEDVLTLAVVTIPACGYSYLADVLSEAPPIVFSIIAGIVCMLQSHPGIVPHLADAGRRYRNAMRLGRHC